MHMVSLFMGLVLVKGVKPRLILSATISYCILMSVVNSTTFHTLFSPLYYILMYAKREQEQLSSCHVILFSSSLFFAFSFFYFTVSANDFNDAL